MTEITLKEYKKEKDELEEMLALQIATCIFDFEKRTGTNVHDLHVNFEDATCLGGSKKSIISSVSVKTEYSD